MEKYYPQALVAYIDKGIELDILDPELKTFDLAKLGAAIDHTRDNQFTYLGLQTLYDRYFIHSNNIRYELPQVFFMRVSMGLAIEEENREDRRATSELQSRSDLVCRLLLEKKNKQNLYRR